MSYLLKTFCLSTLWLITCVFSLWYSTNKHIYLNERLHKATSNYVVDVAETEEETTSAILT